jgi:hypothetical protein
MTEDRKPLRDAVAVHRLAREDGQDHQVEGALWDVQLYHGAPLGSQDDGLGAMMPQLI